MKDARTRRIAIKSPAIFLGVIGFDHGQIISNMIGGVVEEWS